MRLTTLTGHAAAVRIVIADGQTVVRFGVNAMLAHEAEVRIVGEAENGETTFAQTTKLQPDILLLDLQMPRHSGPETIVEIARKLTSVRIVLFTGTITPSQRLEALRLGARGIVEKTSVIEDLAIALRAVYGGDYWFQGEQFCNPIEAHSVLGRRAETPKIQTYGITPRERSAIRCISEGCSNRDIAREFAILEETVKRHLTNIFYKTGVSTRLELALFAITHHLVVVKAA